MKVYTTTRITTEAEAKALPDGTHVFIHPEDHMAPGDAPLVLVKGEDDMFEDWRGDYLSAADIVPSTALIEREVREQHHIAPGTVRPGIGGGTMLVTDHGPESALHERMVWSTDWEKMSEEQEAEHRRKAMEAILPDLMSDDR